MGKPLDHKRPKGKGRPRKPRKHRLQPVEAHIGGAGITIPTGPNPLSTPQYRDMVRVAITNAFTAGIMTRPPTSKPRTVGRFRVLDGQLHIAKPDRAKGAKPFDEKEFLDLLKDENAKGNRITKVILPRWMKGQSYGSFRGLKIKYEGEA